MRQRKLPIHLWLNVLKFCILTVWGMVKNNKYMSWILKNPAMLYILFITLFIFICSPYYVLFKILDEKYLDSALIKYYPYDQVQEFFVDEINTRLLYQERNFFTTKENNKLYFCVVQNRSGCGKLFSSDQSLDNLLSEYIKPPEFSRVISFPAQGDELFLQMRDDFSFHLLIIIVFLFVLTLFSEILPNLLFDNTQHYTVLIYVNFSNMMESVKDKVNKAEEIFQYRGNLKNNETPVSDPVSDKAKRGEQCSLTDFYSIPTVSMPPSQYVALPNLPLLPALSPAIEVSPVISTSTQSKKKPFNEMVLFSPIERNELEELYSNTLKDSINKDFPLSRLEEIINANKSKSNSLTIDYIYVYLYNEFLMKNKKFVCDIFCLIQSGFFSQDEFGFLCWDKDKLTHSNQLDSIIELFQQVRSNLLLPSPQFPGCSLPLDSKNMDRFLQKHDKWVHTAAVKFRVWYPLIKEKKDEKCFLPINVSEPPSLNKVGRKPGSSPNKIAKDLLVFILKMRNQLLNASMSSKDISINVYGEDDRHSLISQDYEHAEKAIKFIFPNIL